MMGIIFRLLWRLLVGLVAIALGYLTAFTLYPYIKRHAHLPTLVMVVLVYLFAAYVGIPLLIRLWQVALKPRHLPLYATSGDGWASDPINIAIICRNQRQLTAVMRRAGWDIADKLTPRTTVHLALAMLLGRSYPTAPFSSLYLFGRRQDVGFQIQTGTPPSPRHRHHVRFWRVETQPAIGHQHEAFWQKVFKVFRLRTREVWIGAATHDVAPFAFRVQNLQLTHQIDSDTDRERDFVITTLDRSRTVSRVETIQTGEPLQFRGQTFGVKIVVDGTIQAVEIKRSIL